MLALAALTGLATMLPADFAATEEPGRGYRLLVLEGGPVKWGAAELGDGVRVTYALATGPVQQSSARNCRSILPVDGLLRAAGLTSGQFETELTAAFAMWSRVANIGFAAGDPDSADIVIGAQAVPRGVAFADVAHLPAAGTEIRILERARICLNPTHGWKIGFDGNPDVYDLRYALAHEIGHVIGLDHPGRDGQVMGFSYSESFRSLQSGDIAGAVALYGGRPADPARSDPVLPAAAAPTGSPATAGRPADTALN